MSCMTLITFKDGKANGEVEYHNSWGGSARIWDALFKAYIPKKHEFDSWLTNNGDDQRLWDLIMKPDLPEFERAVHAFTFDLFYVRNDHFGRFAADLRAFVEKHPVEAGRVDHLPRLAKWLEEHGDIESVGLHGTSVSNNLWHRSKQCPHCGNAMDEMEPVPLSEGTEVYDWLASKPETKVI